KKELFAVGAGKDENLWSSVFRQAMLNGLLRKDIESYGLLKLTEKGHEFIKKPHSFLIPINNNFDEPPQDLEEPQGKTAVLDETLIKLLKDLRRREAKRLGLPPFVIFQDPSLEDMATQYPISMEDMTKVSGVSIGKATRYAKPFIELINKYVEENEIERPTDFVVKQVANKSKVKVSIIQAIDRKIPLDDIASANGLSMDELVAELDAIVVSGTKVNIDYYLEDAVDEYAREDIYDYFMNAESDDPEKAYTELKGDDVTIEEIQLVRIKFLSDIAN
ncbi:MAG: HRDC domain-containing protein, partial [Saprospiraceae bacterium]|nr:HRDC domain-containing protein [Saprospiraceae bacterium]